VFERAIPLSEPRPPRDLTALADPDYGGRKRRGKPHAVSAEFRASGGWNICFVCWRRRAARGRPDTQMWTRGRHEPEMKGSADIRLCRRRQRPAEHQRPLRRLFDQRQTYVEAGRCRDDGRGSGGYRQGSRQAAATRRSRGMYREGSPPRVKAGRWGRFPQRSRCLPADAPAAGRGRRGRSVAEDRLFQGSVERRGRIRGPQIQVRGRKPGPWRRDGRRAFACAVRAAEVTRSAEARALASSPSPT
jgi:hypothetical protein